MKKELKRKMLEIREEKPEDQAGIEAVYKTAFENGQEHELVQRLRGSEIPLISLIAEENQEILGHILFSPVKLLENKSGIRLIGLAPMAVRPETQNRGVGSSLVKFGIKYCLNLGFDAIVVLGHAHYYPRFGFLPASQYGIKSEFDVSNEVFMLLELKQGSLRNKQGTIQYHEVFNKL